MAKYKVIKKFIDRYDYDGAFSRLKEFGLEETNAAKIINSCRYAVNFDFKTAKYILNLVDDEIKDSRFYKELNTNLQNLIDGEPDSLFSELIANIEFQITNEEYIDFLGRVYRFKEAIYKYLFVLNNTDKKRFSLTDKQMEKREILKNLRKTYKIYNSNLTYGISTYIDRKLSEKPKYVEVDKILNSEKMNELIDLRNESIVGHGFKGASGDDIKRAYGNPYSVIDDFKDCLRKLGVKVTVNKYISINKLILELLKEM